MYSQNDEDGIIIEIFNRIGSTNKIFIELDAEMVLKTILIHYYFKIGKDFLDRWK